MEIGRYGYARVSGRDQNEDRQLIALGKLDIPPKNIYLDKQSGKDFNRPAYQAMLRRLRPNDRVYVKSIDRLGRDYQEVMEQWRMITKDIGADITVLDMPLLDTTNSKDLLGTFISDIVLQILSFVAENERDNIRRRQAEGIAAARARGVRFGAPAKELSEAPLTECYKQWLARECTIKKAAQRCGVSEATIARRFRQLRQEG